MSKCVNLVCKADVAKYLLKYLRKSIYLYTFAILNTNELYYEIK